MRLMTGILAVVVGSAGLVAAQAPSPGAPTSNTIRLADGVPRPAARIADWAWIAGRWQGQGLGGSVDEVWSDPAGGSMVGHFRLVKDGKPVFYEIMTVIEADGSLEMRLKHVNPDMTGWEEKADFVTFKLAKIEPDAVYFNGLTFRRTAPDRLEIYLALRNRADGTLREEKFSMSRTR